ncbi:MAG: VWA domain-containing protein [Kosmotoga sp.]|nr:MAG: VWA domain-containing protein [Kosmotoga sp.]
MKRTFPYFFVIFVLLSSMVFSALTIQSIDYSDFPYVKMTLSGEKIEIENLVIYEENIPAKIESLEMHSSVLSKPIDIVFIIDNSGTMEPKINYVKNRTEELFTKMTDQGYNVRFSVVGFGSKVNTEFTGGFSHFTYSVEQAKKWIEEAASYRGGRDECQIEALKVASNYDFRLSASKLMILFTDEDTTQNEANKDAFPDLVKKIIDKNITVFTFYSVPDESFIELARISGGRLFQFNGGDFVDRINEMFTFYEHYATVEYISNLSFPDFDSGEQVTVKVINKENGGSVSMNYIIPGMATIEDMDIVSIDTSDFATVTAIVTVETTKEKRLDFFNIMEDHNRIEPLVIESLGDIKESDADFLFVLDTTASMIQELDTMVNNLLEFTDIIKNSNIRARIGLITFGDEIRLREAFNEDFDHIKHVLKQQNADGGGDVPEISLDAAYSGLTMDFRKNAQKFIILITDAKPHYLGDGTGYSQTTVEALQNKFLDSGTSLILVTPENILKFEKLISEVPGDFYNIKNEEGFKETINKIAVEISSQYRIKYVSPDKRPGTKRLLTVSYGTVGASTTYISPMYPEIPVEVKVFEINSLTAKPFILKPGEISNLRCTVYKNPPEATGLEYSWSAEAGEIVSTEGNKAEWKAPEETGYVSIFINVTSGNITKSAEVVVLVSDNPCYQ